jgi:hypothetical protein
MRKKASLPGASERSRHDRPVGSQGFVSRAIPDACAPFSLVHVFGSGKTAKAASRNRTVAIAPTGQPSCR